MCGCLPTSDRPSSECDASSKNNNERLCAARALTATSGPLTAIRSACGFARDVDVGAVTQGSRHDRLDHGKDVLDPVVELVDHGRQPSLKADPYLDLAGKPQSVVGDIAEQPADDTGQRQADRRH